ncbi:MAG: hypothetical protein F6K55_47525 [Moorea sp. SIO4A3]|nr:hypothetical protein [Moorena sp. SIO4A3]
MVKIAWQREIGLDSPAKYEAGLTFLDISPVKLNTLLERKQLIFSNNFQFKVLLKTFAAAACIVSALAQLASSQTVAPGTILSILLEGLNDRISWVASQNITRHLQKIKKLDLLYVIMEVNYQFFFLNDSNCKLY